MEETIEKTRGRALTPNEAREALRLASRAKWMRNQLRPQDQAGKRLKALETAIVRALKQT